MRVLQVTAEIYPLLKTGGLADVAGALPQALAAAGCDVRALLPGFPAICAGLKDAQALSEFATPWGETIRVLYGTLPQVACGPAGLPAYVLEAPGLYERPGNPYEDAQRRPYADNHRRFAALGWAAARLALGLDPAWSPDIVHGHDWHAGLAPACLRALAPTTGAGVGTIHTVHNLAYQGLFAPQHFGEFGLPPVFFGIDGLEFHGQVSFMKAGLAFADRITTVSPTYAREIQTPEQGFGLDGLLRARAGVLTGILNGVDPAVWNPATDPEIALTFDARRPAGKSVCKAALQTECDLELRPDLPLFAVVSRLTEQKGLPLVLAALDGITASGGQLLVLGTGERELEDAFLREAKAHAGQVAVRLEYDEALAHRIFAGSDVTLVPSRFEPCGLTQMYGLRYGSLPLVRAVGGLADSVVDTDLATLEDQTATGFAFGPFSEAAYRHTLRRAFALYRRRTTWARVRQVGMRRSFSWDEAATHYLDLYRSLVPQ
jgi:starch synthase